MAGLFNNNTTTVTTSGDNEEVTVVTTSDSGVFGSGTVALGGPASSSGIIVNDGGDTGLFGSPMTSSVSFQDPLEIPISIRDNNNTGIFGDGGLVNVVEAGSVGIGPQGPMGLPGMDGARGPQGLPGGPGNDVIADWRGDASYVFHQVAIFTENNLNNVYRATQPISQSGMVQTPGVQEEGTITVDNAAMVPAPVASAPEIVTLTVSGNTGSETFDLATSPVDITNGGTVGVNFTPPSYPLGPANVNGFLIDLGPPNIIVDGVPTQSNLIGVRRADGTAPLFPASANRAEFITNLNNHFSSVEILIGVGSGYDPTGISVSTNFSANPDNSTDIVYETTFTGSFTNHTSVTVAPPTSAVVINLVDTLFATTIALSTAATLYDITVPSELRIVSGSIDEILRLTPGLTTPATIAADIVTEFNANTNLRTLFDAAGVNEMDQVVFQTTAVGDIPLAISEIPRSGTLVVQEAVMDGAAGTFTAPILRLASPGGFTLITLQSSSDAAAIATAIGNALGLQGYTVAVVNNVVNYTRNTTGMTSGISLIVSAQGSSSLVDSQFVIAITQQGAAAILADNDPPNIDTARWELISTGGGGGGPGTDTRYTFADGTNGTFTVTPSDTQTPQTVSVGSTGGGGTGTNVVAVTDGSTNTDTTLTGLMIGTDSYNIPPAFTLPTDVVTSGSAVTVAVGQSSNSGSVDSNGNITINTTAEVNPGRFTQTLDGLVPNPMTMGTTRYLREDGTWVVPPTGSGGGSTVSINSDGNEITIDGTATDIPVVTGGSVAGTTLTLTRNGSASDLTITGLPSGGTTPTTTVDTDFDVATRVLTTTVNGVSDTSTIPGGGGTTVTGTGGIIDGGTLANMAAIIDGGTLG